MKSITITAMARPGLFREMLGSLLACGLDGWHVFVAIEPGAEQDTIARISTEMLPAGQLTVTCNATQLGIRENPKSAIDRAFAAGSDFNLCLEEDFLLAPDALRLADWYAANEQPHWMSLNLLASTCGARGNLSDPQHPTLLFESRGFSSIGVGFSRRNWDVAGPIWRTPKSPRPRGYRGIYHFGWDHALLAHQLANPKLRTVHPVAARCTHQGAIGINCTEEFQRDAFGHIALCARSSQQAGQDGFDLTTINALPRLVAGHAHAQQDNAARMQELINLERNRRRGLGDWLRDLNYQRRQRARARSGG